MQTSREVILNTMTFKGPDRLGFEFPEPYGSDFFWTGIAPSPDARPQGRDVVDEWGAVWDNIGVCSLGEVKKPALESWDDFPALKIPDIRDPKRYGRLHGARAAAGDKFLMGFGISLYERVHFIRGLENTWVDIYTDPGRLCELIDILVDMDLYLLGEFAKERCDAVIFGDDWGL